MRATTVTAHTAQRSATASCFGSGSRRRLRRGRRRQSARGRCRERPPSAVRRPQRASPRRRSRVSRVACRVSHSRLPLTLGVSQSETLRGLFAVRQTFVEVTFSPKSFGMPGALWRVRTYLIKWTVVVLFWSQFCSNFQVTAEPTQAICIGVR